MDEVLGMDWRRERRGHDYAYGSGGGERGRRRRVWSAEEKAALVAASNAPGANVSEIARRSGVGRGLLNEWRREAAEAEEAAPEGFVPVEVAASDPPAPIGAGMVEIDVVHGRIVMRGAVEPGLAQAVVAALRGGS